MTSGTSPREQTRACAAFGDQLTAYLDGELTDGRLSAVRGHLRECAGCRLAADELALVRDGLRELAPVDPPPSLWAGVQAQLAAREVEDAHRPSWRRALARWLPALPRFGGVAIACAAAAMLLWWKAGHRGDDVAVPAVDTAAITAHAPTDADHGKAVAVVTPPAHAIGEPVCPVAQLAKVTDTVDDDTADVATALAAEPARAAARYTAATTELLGLACDARGTWAPAHRDAFDANVTKLRGEVATAAPGRAQDRARRALVRYLQDAVVRDQIAAIDRDHGAGALAGTVGAP